MVKDVAENAECGLLVYLLDMAILESNPSNGPRGRTCGPDLKLFADGFCSSQ